MAYATKVNPEQVKELLIRGMVPEDIAAIFGVTRQSIYPYRWQLVKEGKLSPGKPGRPPGRLNRVKAIGKVNLDEVGDYLESIGESEAKGISPEAKISLLLNTAVVSRKKADLLTLEKGLLQAELAHEHQDSKLMEEALMILKNATRNLTYHI